MASNIIKFRGYCSYAMCYKPDEFMEKEFWKISFYPETEQVMDKIKAKGIRLKVYEDSGEKSGVAGKYIVIKRPTSKEFKDGLVEFNPPAIYGKDGEALVTYDKETGARKGDPILIGNGSLVEVAVSVYDAPPYGKGTRWESVKILDLIEYNPEEKEDAEEEAEEKPAEQKVEAPKEEPKKTTKAKTRW